MKNEYKAEKSDIPCASCIAYCAAGSQYVYSLSAGQKTTHSTIKSTTSKTTTTGFTQQEMQYYTYIFGQYGWGKYTGSQKSTCTVIVGFDQPQDFDLPGMPIDTDNAFACCDKCSATSGASEASHQACCMSMVYVGCKSWVWRSQSKKCFLKKMYDYRRIKETKCDDCVGYAKKGTIYVFAGQSGEGSGQSESAGQTTGSTVSSEKTSTSTTTEMTTTTKWAVGFFGGGVGWQTATAGDASNKCVFSTGYDQPADFNLISRPLNLATALMCCDSCGQNDRKHRPFDDRGVHVCCVQNANHGCGILKRTNAFSKTTTMNEETTSNAMTVSHTARQENTSLSLEDHLHHHRHRRPRPGNLRQRRRLWDRQQRPPPLSCSKRICLGPRSLVSGCRKTSLRERVRFPRATISLRNTTFTASRSKSNSPLNAAMNAQNWTVS